jgi:hypothetical protein
MKRNEKLMKRKFITFISLSVEAKILMQKEAKNVNFISHGSERSKYEAKRKVKEAKQSEKNENFISLLLDAIFHQPLPETAQRYHITHVLYRRGR